ncbi:MAG: hypothetical protein DME04_03405 [Candidatus Rokuibacteriota bacterium]|nr:MAG: hypothetical protein DME04_03405 [Candidatus Rokubacteria bacterium]
MAARGFEMPRLARISGTIGPGPSDRRMYVVDALRKDPYRDPDNGDPIWFPPYPKSMPHNDPVPPAADGHFDHLEPGTREFSAAAAFAAAHCAFEVWEHYLGRRLRLVTRRGQHRLEIVPRVTKIGDGAWSGEGFIECGFANQNQRQPYCENIDVVAHECGHIILKRVIGRPPKGRREFDRRSHDEAGADLVALICVLHFDSVVNAVMAQTRGKLYSLNILSQIGEYRQGSGHRAIRTAFQGRTMASVSRARRADNKHLYAQPLLGAAFDILVEMYEDHLVRRGLIDRDLARRSTRAAAKRHSGIRREFAARYALNPDGFADSLRDATADFAYILALAWRKSRRTGVTFSRVASNIAAADLRLNQGRYGQTIRRAFKKRQIGVRLSRP